MWISMVPGSAAPRTGVWLSVPAAGSDRGAPWEFEPEWLSNDRPRPNTPVIASTARAPSAIRRVQPRFLIRSSFRACKGTSVELPSGLWTWRVTAEGSGPISSSGASMTIGDPAPTLTGGCSSSFNCRVFLERIWTYETAWHFRQRSRRPACSLPAGIGVPHDGQGTLPGSPREVSPLSGATVVRADPAGTSASTSWARTEQVSNRSAGFLARPRKIASEVRFDKSGRNSVRGGGTTIV